MADDYEAEVEESDEGFDVDVPEKEEEDRANYDTSHANMVPSLMETAKGRELCRELACKAILEFNLARDSSEEYRRGLESDWKVFLCDLPPKEPPFDKLANLAIPQTLENITRLWFRGIGELFGDWRDLFGVVPTGPDDKGLADILSRHGNWQLAHIPDFRRQQMRGLMMYYLYGDVTFYSYRDTARRCNRHVALDVDEFYAPFSSLSVMPNWDDVPYRGRILNYYRHDIEKLSDLWYGTEKVLARKPTWEDEPEDVLRRGIADVHGEEMPSDGPAPYKLIMHQTWCKLPGMQRAHFMRMIVDLSTESLLMLNLHEAPSFAELGRFRRETESYNAYMQSKMAYEEAMASVYDSGGGNPEVDAAIGGLAPPAPERPSWMGATDAPPEEPASEPIQEFSHAVCIEPLRGAFGFGFGRPQAAINRVSNSGVNHQIDAWTLNNFPALFVASSAGLDRLRIGPGQLNKVVTNGKQSIQELVQMISVTGNDAGLMELVKYLDQRGREGIQSPEVLSGAPGKSGQTAREQESRVAEATKTLSVSTRNYADHALTPVLIQNARLNSIYMPAYEPFFVNDDQGNPEMFAAGREMYRRAQPYRVTIRSDLKFASDTARIADADAMVAQSMADPMLQGNIHFGHQVRKDALRARGKQELIPMLGDAPMGPPPPFGTPPQLPPGVMPPGQQGGPPPEGAPQ